MLAGTISPFNTIRTAQQLTNGDLRLVLNIFHSVRASANLLSKNKCVEQKFPRSYRIVKISASIYGAWRCLSLKNCHTRSAPEKDEIGGFTCRRARVPGQP